MFNSKKIEALKIQVEELKKSLESLRIATQNITNFNELYDKILDSYNNSKALINEQLLQYDKKIIENTAVVDERLLSFQTKIDNILGNTIDELRKNLIDKSLEIQNTILSLEEDLKVNLNTHMQSEKLEIENNFKEQNDKISKVLTDKVEEISLKFDKLVEQHEEIWNENLLKHNNDINNKLNSYEINLNEMISSAVFKQLNNLIIDDVTIKSTELILNAFNKSLLDLGNKEKKSIVEAIRALITPNLPIKKIDNDEMQINPLSENELFHICYDKLKLCVTSNIIPMIVGPAGTGKSTAAEQLSRDLGLRFYMANRIQNTFELVGFVNAAGEYVTTQFYEAYTKGGIFLFDEVDASSPEALVTINAAIAQGYMAFPGHPTALPMHKDFKAICAGNTFGTGSTLQYTGRNKLDAATLDRFMIIEWDYDKVLEDKIINDKDLLNLCWCLREVCPTIDKSIIISTRGIVTLEKMLTANKDVETFLVKDLFRQKFFENVSKSNLKKIFNAIADECKGNFFLKFIGELSK